MIMRDHAPPVRIQLSRARGWRMPAYTVKVDRATIWGNPWRSPGSLCVTLDGIRMELLLPASASGFGMTTAEAVDQFRDWLAGKTIPPAHLPDILNDKGRGVLADHLHGRRRLILSRIEELRGKNLACWCPPGSPCHADVLMKLAVADCPTCNGRRYTDWCHLAIDPCPDCNPAADPCPMSISPGGPV